MAKIDSGLASLRTRSIWARSLIGIFIFVHVLFLGFAGFVLWQELSTGFGIGYLLLAPSASVAGLLALIATAIPVLMWVHRAGSNLVEGGASDLAHSPGWTVASCFIPLVNLLVPFRAMRELANRSNGEDAWQSNADVGDVSAWWSCWIAGNVIQAWLILSYAFNVLTNLEILVPPGVNSGLAVFGIALLIGSAVFLWRIVAAVTKAQQSMTGVAQAFA